MSVMNSAEVLSRKAIIVTGAGKGLGAAYARLAAMEGARVFVNDINAAAAAGVAAEICAAGGVACADESDVSTWDGAAGLVSGCVKKYGALDGLVNNAALFYMASPDEEEEVALRRLIDVNVLGTMFCGIHALRHMMSSGHGSIVNVTSGAQAGIALQGAYGASKGAVASLTYSWSLDAAVRGVRVNAVAPMAQTSMAQQAATYFQERGREPWPELGITPEENAPVVAYLLSDLSSAVNGQIVRIDGERLALMTHPAVLHPPIECRPWSIAAVSDAFQDQLAALQLPCGVIGTEIVLRPYALSYTQSSVAGRS